MSEVPFFWKHFFLALFHKENLLEGFHPESLLLEAFLASRKLL